ncbi:hypothetical protein HPB47_013351 [Ixodes persulcatus]|uniref:Uncharacterized protein n=1 Tax=Ixodes persulcatus TaxID=34615 RepID=A0AC60QYY8_IXOPE|nr:hypothetical protein HPB47_013351 [Ixodes persulcatus]
MERLHAQRQGPPAQDRPSRSRERPGAANNSRGGHSRSFPKLPPGEGRGAGGRSQSLSLPWSGSRPGPVQRSRRRHHSHGRTTTNNSRDQARNQTNNNW